MIRYLRLYSILLQFSVSRAMAFRIDFYSRIVLDMVIYAVNILFFQVLFMHTDILGDWNQEQMLIFVTGYMVVDATRMAFLSSNHWAFPDLINRGGLDFYLVRPVSSFFLVSLKDFSANSFISLLLSISVFAYALASYSAPLTLDRIFLFCTLLINGVILSHLVQMLLLLPVFWLQGGRGLEGLFWTLKSFMERPDSIFTGAMRKILLTILPFSVMVSLPAYALFSDNPLQVAGICLSVTCVFSIVFALLWKRSLKAYSSASS